MYVCMVVAVVVHRHYSMISIWNENAGIHRSKMVLTSADRRVVHIGQRNFRKTPCNRYAINKLPDNQEPDMNLYCERDRDFLRNRRKILVAANGTVGLYAEIRLGIGAGDAGALPAPPMKFWFNFRISLLSKAGGGRAGRQAGRQQAKQEIS
uniref:Uncharacterized protein n=1 Tax=Glossina austeni TaxID=7395 RepID=A0A1A9VYE3_GLOAU